MSILRASVLGGVDGVITSFAVVASVHAGSLATRVVVVVGISSVIADGVSMGVSEYLSSYAEAARGSHGGGDGRKPLALGVACFTSFVVGGVVPLAT